MSNSIKIKKKKKEVALLVNTFFIKSMYVHLHCIACALLFKCLTVN